MNQPSGELATFLFADLADPAELSRADAGDAAFRALHRLVSEAAAAHGGPTVTWMGDGFMAAYPSAVDAVQCAIALQQAARRPIDGMHLHVRAALHAGEAPRGNAEYLGTASLVARRLCERASGGDVLASGVVAGLLSNWPSFQFESLGTMELKGVAAPIGVCRVLYERQPFALVSQTPFVGRGTELGVLSQRLRDMVDGRGSVVLLAGEPGIGKSRLAEEFAGAARHEGAVVLTGHCYEGDWAPPFGPFVEAIDGYQTHVGRDELRADLGRGASIIARLVPAILDQLPDVPEPPTVAPEEERFRLLDGVSHLIASASARAPVVIVLDDLHWADKGTVAMLRHVGRACASQRTMIVGTYRDVEVDERHPLSSAISALRRDAAFELLSLTGLDDDEVGGLLRIVGEQQAPDTFVSALVAETKGNPLFIREILIRLVQEGRERGQTGDWPEAVSTREIGVPEGVREAIGRRIAGLSDPCRRMLLVASAMSGGFSWEVLRAAAAVPEGPLLEALEEALRAQIVEEREHRDTQRVSDMGFYDFTHALIRNTLYEQMSTPRRLRLHRQIGDAIEDAYSDLGPHFAELAYHYERAAEDGDADKAVEYASQAGDRALAVYAYDEAVRQYERGLSRLQHVQERPDERSCRLLVALGEARSKSGDEASAKRSFREAAEAAKTLGAPQLLAQAALGYGREFETGAVDQSIIDLLAEALTALGDEDSAWRARVLAGIASALYFSPDRERIDTLSREAIAVARSAGDTDALIFALHSRHFVMPASPDVEERLALATELIALAEERRDLTMVMQGYMWRVCDLLEAGDVEGVDSVAKVAMPRMAELGLSLFHYYDEMLRGSRALLEGRLGEAEGLIGRALAAGQKVPNQNPLQLYGVQMFALRWLQGRLAEIEPVFKGLSQQFPAQSSFRSALAFLSAELDRRDDARREFEVLAQEGFEDLPRDAGWTISIALLAQVAAYLGDAPRANQLYELLLPFSGRCVLAALGTASAGAGDRYLGLLAATLGRRDDAARHFEGAIEMNERMGARPFTAFTQAEYAELLLGEPPDEDRARTLLDSAEATGVDLDLRGLLPKIQLLRERLGTAPRA